MFHVRYFSFHSKKNVSRGIIFEKFTKSRDDVRFPKLVKYIKNITSKSWPGFFTNEGVACVIFGHILFPSLSLKPSANTEYLPYTSARCLLIALKVSFVNSSDSSSVVPYG